MNEAHAKRAIGDGQKQEETAQWQKGVEEVH